MLNSLKWLKFVFKEPQFKSQERKGAWIRAERVKSRPLVSHLTTLMIATESTGSVAQAGEISHCLDGLQFPSVVHYCELWFKERSLELANLSLHFYTSCFEFPVLFFYWGQGQISSRHQTFIHWRPRSWHCWNKSVVNANVCIVVLFELCPEW